MSRHLPTTAFAALLVFAALLFSLNAGGYALWPADEPRFAEAAREMLLSGDYLVPRINGEVYLEKPPLLFWITAAFSAPIGQVTEWPARLPSILSALLVVALTYLLARDLYNPRVAFWAAVILMTCVRFWWQARTGQLDMLLTGCMTTSLYALWRWHKEHHPKYLLLLYLGIALGLLTKGPPALVFPLLFICAFYWRRKEERRRLHWVVGSLAAIAVVAAWFIPARLAAAAASPEVTVQSGIGGNLLRNTLGRFLLGVSKAQPPWYYIESLIADLFPWTLFLPFAVWWIWKNRREGESMRFLLAWTVPALIFFSISIGKRAIYILPLFPAMAILLAVAVLALTDSDRTRWLRGIRGVWCAILLILGCALFAIPWTPYPDLMTGPIITFATLLIVLSVVAALRRQALHATIAAQFIVILIGAALVVLPAVDTFKSAKDITTPVRALSNAGEQFSLYSVGFDAEEYIFYSRHFHETVLKTVLGPENMTEEELITRAKQQKDARELLIEAVEEVPITNLGRITNPEREALRAAIESAVANSGEEAEATEEFERLVLIHLREFLDRFTSSTPAFLYVQEEDWRWIAALLGPFPGLHVLKHEIVGSREVLLIGNDAGNTLALTSGMP